jgi:chromosome segregation ATPase
MYIFYAMFNNDFFELKKALELVTLEVTDLKNELYKKDNEIKNLKAASKETENSNLKNTIHNLQQKIIDQDIQIRELKFSIEPDQKTILKLRDKAQSLNDRIAGLVKENENLKREAIAQKMITNTFKSVKGLVNNLKQKQPSQE